MDRPLVRHLTWTLDGLEMARRTRYEHHSQEIPILLAELSRVPLHVAGLLESLKLFPLVFIERTSIFGVVKTGRVRRSVFQRNGPKLDDSLLRALDVPSHTAPQPIQDTNTRRSKRART